MMVNPLTLPYFSFLAGAQTYLCYVVSWWQGAGTDAVGWLIDRDLAGRRIVLFTGETLDPKLPRIVVDEEFPSAEVEALIEEFCSMRGHTLVPQLKVGYPLSHFDLWYGVKRVSDVVATWIPVCNAYYEADPEIDRSLTKFFSQHVEVLDKPWDKE